MMGLCKDCAHWDRDHYRLGRDEHSLILGRCARVPMLFEMISYTASGVQLKDCARNLKAFAQDGSDYSAVLLTLGDFGCIQFESMREPQGIAYAEEIP